MECSCRLWPIPGIYVVTSIPLVRRTRATLRSAEFGFFGVWVNTRTQTPRFCGLSCSAGLLVFVRTLSRPLRTSWLIVGTVLNNSSRVRVPAHAKTCLSFYIGGVFRPRPYQEWRNRFGVPGLGSRKRGPAPGTDLPYK